MEKFNHFLAITVCSWLLALMVIVSELFPPFKGLLTGIFSHHWIGKAVILAVVFVLSGLFVQKKVSEKTAFNSVVAGIAIILAFFVFEFLKG